MTKFLVLKGQDIREQFGVNQWLERKRVITSLDLAKRADILPGLAPSPLGSGHRGRGPPHVWRPTSRTRACDTGWASSCATRPTTSSC